MKRFLLGTAIAFGAMSVAMSGAQAKDVFALVPKNMNNPFFDQARDGCKKAEAESKGAFQCMYIGPGEHGGGEDQVQILQDLVAKKVDGIAVAPSNAAAAAVALQAAKAAGINFIHLPFNGAMPDPAVVDNFLKAISQPGNQPAFIHCASGNRAATVWFIKRVLLDKWDNDQAMAEASQLGAISQPMKNFAMDYIQSHKK